MIGFCYKRSAIVTSNLIEAIKEIAEDRYDILTSVESLTHFPLIGLTGVT